MEIVQNQPRREVNTFIVRKSMYITIIYIFITQFLIVFCMFLMKTIIDFIVRDFQATLSIEDFQMWSTITLQFINIFITLYLVIDWLYTYYIVRPHEVIYRKGVLLEQRIDFKFENIKKIDIKQGFLGKLLDFGTIKVYRGGLHEEAAFEDFPNPKKYVEIISRKAENNILQ